MDDPPVRSPSSPAQAGVIADSKLGHSEVYFGSSRDYWWNADFIALMARRLNFAGRRKVLEVGCGSGHWARTLMPFLDPLAEITAVDRDPKWADPNAAWAQSFSGTGAPLKLRQADACSLPFGDSSFDLVTCQTLLIHLADPTRALAEMLRVLEPGGLLLCSEPDNFAVQWAQTSLSGSQSLDEAAAAFRFALAQHRGRISRGLGNLSFGGRLPAQFAAAGLAEIGVHLSDKAIPLYPPYREPEQAAMNADTEHWYQVSGDLTQAEARANFLAGGGSDSDFGGHWSRELLDRERYFGAIQRGEYDRGGGVLMYLVSGTKARPGLPPIPAQPCVK